MTDRFQLTESTGSAGRASDAKIVSAILVLAGVCLTVSLLAFRLRWGAWPEADDFAMSVSLLAPIALPTSFARAVGLRVAPQAGVILLQMALFWLAATGLLVVTVRRNSRTAFGLLSLLCLVASFYWQDMTGAILGI